MKKKLTLALALTLGLSSMAAGYTPAQETEETYRVWTIDSVDMFAYRAGNEKINTDWYCVSADGGNGWEYTFKQFMNFKENEGFDVYLCPFDTELANSIYLFAGLDEWITPENTPNIWTILERNPGLKESLTVAHTGQMHTLFDPDMRDLDEYPCRLWVNRQFMERYTDETGNGAPETVSELEEMLEYFGSHDMNGDGELNEVPYCGLSGIESMYALLDIFLPDGISSAIYGYCLDENGEIQFTSDERVCEEALNYIRGLYERKLIHPDIFTMSAEERYELTSGNKDAVRAGVVTGMTINQVVKLTDAEGMAYSDYVELSVRKGSEESDTEDTDCEERVLHWTVIPSEEDAAVLLNWLDGAYREAAERCEDESEEEFAKKQAIKDAVSDYFIDTIVGDLELNGDWGYYLHLLYDTESENTEEDQPSKEESPEFDVNWVEGYVMPIPEPPFAYKVRTDASGSSTVIYISSTNGGKDGDVTHEKILAYCNELKEAGFTDNIMEGEIGERYGRTCYNFGASNKIGCSVGLIDDGGGVLITVMLPDSSANDDSASDKKDSGAGEGNKEIDSLLENCGIEWEIAPVDGDVTWLTSVRAVEYSIVLNWVNQLIEQGYEETKSVEDSCTQWKMFNPKTSHQINVTFTGIEGDTSYCDVKLYYR